MENGRLTSVIAVGASGGRERPSASGVTARPLKCSPRGGQILFAGLPLSFTPEALWWKVK